MSFSSEIRKALCEGKAECDKCCLAELAGIISFSGDFNADRLKLVTEAEHIAARITEDIFLCTGVKLCPKGGRNIKIETTDAAFLEKLKIKLGIAEEKFEDKYKNDCCKKAFIRGAFLGGGCVADPGKNYHLEFDTKYKISATRLYNVIVSCGITPKMTYRKGHYLVYLKGSDDIADILGLMGANMGALRLYTVQMEKDIRNNVNRRVNCETANQEKVSAAASKQLAAIKRIRAKGAMGKLPDSLKEIAELREENPDISLKELGEMLNPPIGKSGVNHRLSRIIDYANGLH